MSWVVQSISKRANCLSNRGYGTSLVVAAAVSVSAYVAHKYVSARQHRASQSKSELVANLRFVLLAPFSLSLTLRSLLNPKPSI